MSPCPAPALFLQDGRQLQAHETTPTSGHDAGHRCLLIRNVTTHSTVTYCVPGATVCEIEEKAIGILVDKPDITKVIIHVGTNVIRRQHSELLKSDFQHLFSSLKRSARRVYMSGPLPSCGCGIGRFSRLLSLHTWLSSTCAAQGVSFIDNFSLFWRCPQLFKDDGIHPNWLGAKLLASNISYCVAHLGVCPLHMSQTAIMCP